MKKHYLKPSLVEVNLLQGSILLCDSSKVHDIDGNTEIDYGGGGHVDPMAPEYDDDWDADDEW